jgi:hypothetical protein
LPQVVERLEPCSLRRSRLPEITMTVLDGALAAGDAGRVTDERQDCRIRGCPRRRRQRTFAARWREELAR